MKAKEVEGMHHFDAHFALKMKEAGLNPQARIGETLTLIYLL